MGLDISVGGYGFRAGSYSGFAEFRAVLAKHALNIELDSMEGFGKNGVNSWDTIKSGLKILLDHSDCDGEIYPNQAKELLSALNYYRMDKRGTRGTKAMKSSADNEWYWAKINDWIIACKESVGTGLPIVFG